MMRTLLKPAMLALALVSFGALNFSSSAQQSKACGSLEYKQFNFWLGNWEVYDYASGTKGARAGSNRVVSLLDGCAIQENWTGSDGGHGTSYNSYFNLDHLWHQTWVDDTGYRLELAGQFKDGAMVLEGAHPGQRAGVTIRNRISWSLIDNNPNQVRQLWQQSRDDGANWQAVFDGLYQRVP